MKGTQKGAESSGTLVKALSLKAREMISVVGAGGKTTLMFRLAKELTLSGNKVVTTTTTKILEPDRGETGSLIIDPDEQRIKNDIGTHLDQYRHVTIACERLESGKLRGISSALANELWYSKKIDMIIVEADGAARRPVKAPRENEPVIPTGTTLVVAMLGMDGVDRELNEENVFQPRRVSRITGIPIGERLTEEAMATLITHAEGISKGTPATSRIVVFLNKVDVPNGLIRAKSIAQDILKKKHPQIERVVLGQLKSEPPVTQVIFP